jgi:hypothetical protein
MLMINIFEKEDFVFLEVIDKMDKVFQMNLRKEFLKCILEPMNNQKGMVLDCM